MKTFNRILGSSILLLISTSLFAQDAFKAGFLNPPQAAKPRVWWHWMNGNISKEGIQKDLEWMSKSGIGGFQNFDASLMSPIMVKEKLSYMTAPWKEAFKFTTQLAKEKGLEMAIAGSPGWSVTGGPWVKPGDAMKKYVWTETMVEGGKMISTLIARPSSATGPMQNVQLEAGGFGVLEQTKAKEPEFYQDIAVIAYPILNKESSLQELKSLLTTSGGNFSITKLSDGDLENFDYLEPKKPGEETYIQYEFAQPTKIYGITFANEGYGELAVFRGAGNNRFVQYSEDGINFKELVKVPGLITSQNTLTFAPLMMKKIRLVYVTLPPAPAGIEAMFGAKADPNPKGTKISEFVVHTSPKVHLFEAKAGFVPWKESFNETVSTEMGAKSEDVLDITSFMKPDGSLAWNAPAGKWAIIRFGYSLTGKKNHPASPEATGLEVDKLDREAVTRYLENYLDQYKDASGGLMGNEGLTHMVLDSYEAGHMTWTPSMMEEFKTRRGYDLKPFMPVLVGRIINSAAESEKFLWDFRKTIGELIVENHYELIGELLSKRGMKRYTESHESGRIYLADGMDVKRFADVPMSAMWQPGALAAGKDEEIRSRADIRESASVAHIYGQNIAAGESMTTIGNSFSPHPGTLKRTADMEMASGLNRFVIHTSVHQPLDNLYPGFSLGPFGQWFTRQETWADQAKVWAEYLGRSSYLLQAGKNVADVLYYYGENTNITSQFANALPAVPAGYEFDFVNSTALKNAISVEDKVLVSKGGTKYSVLALDESAQKMTLGTLKRILELAKDGAIVTGTAPMASPTLVDNPKEYASTLQSLKALANVHFGKDLKTVLIENKVREDLLVSEQKAEVLFQHRKADGKDIYWLNSRSPENNSAKISFRVKDKIPFLFDPQTGKISKVSYELKGGRTELNIKFSPWDAQFIVFDGISTTNKLVIPEPKLLDSKRLEGPWTIKFQKDRSAPNEIKMDQLMALNKSEIEGVKYFSGAATYVNRVDLMSIAKDEKIELDLGDVKNLAEVIINGNLVATLWKKPFKVDITDALKMGKNTLEIKVVNSWVNRLVGDTQPNAKKITFTALPFFQAGSPTEESGLLGPVLVNRLK
ncbi:glycosyl hydrolase [Aquirufa sp. ROCK2-A2]